MDASEAASAPAPFVFACGGDAEPASVAAEERLIGGGGEARRAKRLVRLARGQVLGDAQALQGHSGAQHADVDSLALAGAMPRQQAHEHRLRRDVARRGVQLREVAVDLGSPAARAVGRPEAGEVLALHIGAGLVAHCAELAPAGDCGVDEVGIDRAQLFVAHSQPLRRAVAHVDQQHIAGFDQSVGRVAIGLGFEVEEHSALVHVPGDVADGCAVDHGRAVAAERAGVDAGLLDVDDVRAERAQLQRGPGADQPEGEVEYAHAVEGSWRHWGLRWICAQDSRLSRRRVGL